MRTTITTLSVIIILSTSRLTSAATIEYGLEICFDGTFKVIARTDNDSFGISGYGVDLVGDITSLVHSTPTSATAHTNGTDFGPSGFSLARSADNANFVLASQDVNNAATHALYRVGQQASSFADQGIIAINGAFETWAAEIVLATGTYAGSPNSLGFDENGPNLGGNVFVDDQGLAVKTADIVFRGPWCPEPSTLLLTTLGLIGFATQRRRG